MADFKTISSVDNWNLNAIYSNVMQEFENKNYPRALKLSQEGLVKAGKTNDKEWVEKFNLLYEGMIKAYNNWRKIKKSQLIEQNAEIISPKLNLENKNGLNLTQIKGIGQSAQEKLKNAEITTITQLADFSPDKLSQIKGFGIIMACNIIKEAKKFLKEQNQEYEIHSDLGSPASVDDSLYDNSSFKITDFIDNIALDENSVEPEEELISEDLEPYELEVGAKTPPSMILSVEPDTNSQENNCIDEEASIEPADCNVPQPEIEQETSLDFDNAAVSNQEIINIFLNKDRTVAKSIPKVHDTNCIDSIKSNFYGEKLDNNRIKTIRRSIEESLKSSGYFVIPGNFSISKTIDEYIDLVAVKVFVGDDDTELIIIIAAKVCDLKGTLLVSDDKLDYIPVNKDPQLTHKMKVSLLKPSFEDLAKAVGLIFHNITQEGVLFKFFAKYLKEGISIEKSKNNRPFFFRSGLLQYKLLIEPILICQSEPASLEKSVPFPYQKRQNIHYAHYENLSELVKFLENKYRLIETYAVQKNTVKTYFNAVNKFNIELKNYSIPFVMFGFAFLLIMLTQMAYLINLFIKLGYAAIGIYATVLFYLYLKLYKKKVEISEEFNSPYHLRNNKLDEADLLMIKEELSTELLDQFIYECFGKTPHFKILSQIEEEKSNNFILNSKNKQNEIEVHKDEKFMNNTVVKKEPAVKLLKDRIISKYSSFLED